MAGQTPGERLRRLKSLITDYSYPERRYPGIVRDIDALLSWALSEQIKPGSTFTSVKNTLGEPHIVVGEESDEICKWLYPCLAPEGETKQVARWFFVLQFRQGLLESIERRGLLD